MDAGRPSSAQKLALAVILVVAAVLRFAGIGFGLPLELRPDEEIFRSVVARMAETGDLNPHRWEYGGPIFHLLYGVLRIVHRVAAALGFDAGDFAVFTRRAADVARIQRWMSAGFGVATVALSYATGRRMRSAAAGLLAAALLAVMFLPVRDSHFGTIDSLAAFATALALFFIVRASQVGTAAAWAVAGASAGLATAIRFSPVVLALPLAVAAWRAARRRGAAPLRAVAGAPMLIAGTAMVLGFLLCSPYLILSFDEFRNAISGVVLVRGNTSINPVNGLLDVAARFVLFFDWPFAIASVLAVVVSLFGKSAPARGLSVFVLAYVGVVSFGTAFFCRWLNPIVPPLCVLVALLIDRVTAPLPRPALASAVLGVLVAALPATRSVLIDRLFLRETTFEKAAEVLRTGFPADATVACPDGGVARVLGAAAGRLTPWDPRAFASRPEWYAVIPEHPITGMDPGWASVVLPALGEVTSVASIEGSSGDWNGVVFERSDFFFYPVTGLGAVTRAGPRFRILRIAPKPLSSPNEPAPPRLSVTVGTDSIRIAFEPAAGTEALGYYVRFATEDSARAGSFFGPYFSVPGFVELPIYRAGVRGRYVLASATVSRAGLGPWSDPVLVTID